MKQIISPETPLDQTFLETSAGTLLLQANKTHLQRVDWHTKQQNQKETRKSPLLKQAVQELKEYFSGKRQHFEVPYQLQGTPFQQAVWRGLCNIPYGETISYSELAASIEKPKAIRAAGSANGKNPLSILIPCHRVIAADGGIGGYTGGLDKKRFLLSLEANINH